MTNTYSAGLRTNLSLAQPTGQWTNMFIYDAAKRLTNVTSPAGVFAYSLVGYSSRLTQKLSLPNTSYITNTYDGNARLLGTSLNMNENTTASSGSLAGANTYQFSSKMLHTGSGFYYYGYRWYAPMLQRWLNRDPLATYPDVQLRTRRGTYKLNPWERLEGPNLFTYVHNNPVNAVDVNGLWTLDVGVWFSHEFVYFLGGNIGIYVGHDPSAGLASGWSFGVLGGPAVGVGGPVNLISGGGFIQATTAKCVADLKGISVQAGGSGTIGPGTGPSVGGEGIAGLNSITGPPAYLGGEFDLGWGLGFPVEGHVTVGLTAGWDTEKGWK